MSKVTIIGGGHVGITTAFALLLRQTAREIVLYDRNLEKILGEQLDLQHSLSFLPNTDILAAKSPEDTKDSDVIVFTSGIAQLPGQSRLELLNANKEIVKNILPEIIHYSPQGVVIMVSNPVDILTFEASNLLNLPRGRIFGTGTTLDSSRFRFYLSEMLGINSKNIHAYILGEHGDSSFPAISSIDVGGQSLLSMSNVKRDQVDECFTKTKDAAKEIIAAKGSTYYAISVVVSQLAHSVLSDSKRIFPVSVPLRGEYGQNEVSLSVPCVIGKNGAERILEISLSEEEKQQLQNSVHILKSFITT